MIACLYREAKNLKSNFINIAISFITVLVITFMVGKETFPIEQTIFLGIIILCFMQFMTIMFDQEIFGQIDLILATPLKIKEIVMAKTLCLSLLVLIESIFYYMVCYAYFKAYFLNIWCFVLCIIFIILHSLFFGKIIYIFLKKSKIWITTVQIGLFIGIVVISAISQIFFMYLLTLISLLYIFGLYIGKKDDKEKIIKRSLKL